MLPKVKRDGILIDFGNEESSGVNRYKLRMMSAAGIRGQGRRAVLTKSAHLTNLGLDTPLLTADQLRNNNLRPYFPYSAKPSSSPTRQIRARKETNTATLWKWKTDANGYKSEYSYSRVRAHSHKSSKTDAEGKSMPYLVPKSGTSASSSATRAGNFSHSPDRVADLRKAQMEKVIKAKPMSAVPSSSSAQKDKDSNSQGQSSTSQLGGMVMMGTGKAPGIVNSSVSVSTSKVHSNKERVQVCRTKEEKEKNPETIRLDKTGLRVFPDIGGGESVTLKLLSLQHNLITRLENVPMLSQLVVLDLYDNRVERINGLQGLPSLRVLLLGKNRLKRIEGLESLKRLEILDLHGNQLRYVDNLGPLISLRVLNLAGNLLRNIRNLGPYGMSSLTELNLKRNRIKNLEGLQKAPHLKRLLIANNDLQSISSLAPLRKLSYLRELVIDPNPLLTPTCVGPVYRNQILTLFPGLSSLDRNQVTDEMKAEARLWHKKKLAEEEARKQEEARLREEMVSKVGPGSREQVIYQARRRWESLKNYVKHNNNEPPSTSASSRSSKKPLKTMKSVVSAATAGKPGVLYPPATLDLEEFLDGQVELDKTESLLGSTNDKKEARRSSLVPGNAIEEFQNEEIGSDESSLASTPEPDDEESGQSHFAPLLIRSNFNKPNDFQSQGELHDNDTDTFTLVHQDDDNQYIEQHSLPISSPQFENDEVPGTSGVPSEGRKLFMGYQEELVSARSTVEALLSPIADYEREKSTRVAIVRPLVRVVSLDENLARSSPSDIEIDESAFTPVLLNGEIVGMSENLASAKDNFDSEANQEYDYPAKQFSPESLPFEETFTEKYETDTKVREKDANDVTATSVIEEASAVTKENIQSTATPNSSVPKEESGRTKLLKHLRSISLDSYPHQFFNSSGKEKLDESLPLSDDNEEEDEDDNDNEVQDYDDDAYSIATSTTTTGTSISTPRRNSTTMVTTNRLLKGGGGGSRKQIFPRTKSQRIKIRDRAAKLFGSSTELSARSMSTAGITKRVGSGVGTRGGDGGTALRSGPGGRVLRRCDSAISLSSTMTGTASVTSSSGNTGSSLNKPNTTTGGGNSGGGGETDNKEATPHRKQGADFLVEVEGKILNVFGQGGLRHALTAFIPTVTNHVCTAKFHYISYDSIIPFFGKLRQVFPALEHFHFRANNLCYLAQLDALSDLQGLTTLSIAKEGNPIVSHDAWGHYASYRLSHWGLQAVNGKEICTEYRGGITPAGQAKQFESLGFLALSCLPQTALTPLARRLHMLHCFCCCSPSSSSDESSRPQRLLAANSAHNTVHHGRSHSPSQAEHGATGNFCTAWDDDPVLLDVIGKEALVYCPPPLPLDDDHEHSVINRNHEATIFKDSNTSNRVSSDNDLSHERKRAETLGDLIQSGVEIVEKVDQLERVWPTLLAEVIQEMLMDFRFMDAYMKKELKRAQDITLINQQQHHHSRKNRH